MTTAELLTALQTELATRFSYDATIMYTRVADLVEIASRRVILQPASFEVSRTGKSDPRRLFLVDLISEERVAAEDVEATAQTRVAEFEEVANSFTRSPWLGESTAFCLAIKTFGDAPGAVNTQIVEGGLALVLSGVQFTFVEN